MKPLRYVLAGATVLLLTVAGATASQDQPPVKAPPPGAQVQPLPGFQPGGIGGDLISTKGLEKLALNKEQKADYDKIEAEFKKLQKELQAKLKDLKDPGVNIGEIFRAQQKLRPDYLAKVEGLLTVEQKTSFAEIRRGAPGIGIGPGGQPGGPFPIFPGLGGELISAKGLEKLALSKEQKTDFDKINAEFQKKHKDLTTKLTETFKTDPSKAREGFGAVQNLRPEYLTKVEALLTDEQKTTFQAIRRETPGIGIGPGPDLRPPFFGGMRSGEFLPAEFQQRLKLSDDQKKQINDLQKELEAKILKVLTDEQRRQFEEMRKQPGPPRIGLPPNPFELQPPPPPLPPELKKAPAPGLERGGN